MHVGNAKKVVVFYFSMELQGPRRPWEDVSGLLDAWDFVGYMKGKKTKKF